MKTTTMGALIGSLSGGLLAYYLTRSRPWAAVKKVVAVAAGAAGGGAVGWGIAKIPIGAKRSAMAGYYPPPRSSASIIEEAAHDERPMPIRARSARTSCKRPPDELRGDLLQ